MKKRIITLIVLAMTICLTGCLDRKTFDTGMGIRFTLDKNFAQEEPGGYDFCFSNEKSLMETSSEQFDENCVIILGLRDSFSDLRESEPEIGEDLQKYVEYQTQYGDYADIKLLKKGIYVSESTFEGYYYRYVFLKGKSAFFMVTFICDADSQNARAKIDEYIEGIKLR